ncbi:multiple sugar transport system substrate-binding protein [Natronincola peptidivorans]|uniref:Multiple sugar transport system substrate-binding protein n=1 Tax=Natronincola peptidivorans TaxID=426128 RepID=A0A1I0CZV1_9FIRM|nr:extracellular solute-binding protein [Natronincola peptidivorans]SET25192.1 multiple sugar transport system substrate-binding protein [Natronincola peptidivorans]
MEIKQLNILAVGDPAVYGYVEEKFQIISQYEKRNNLKVHFHIVEWEKYYDTMMQAFEGKENYDVVMVAGHLWLKDFASKGYLAPVKYPDNDDYHKEDILPVIREEMELEGKPYLYPSFCDGHIVLYRKSILKERIGYLPNKVISTDELINIVQQCDGLKEMKGFALKAHPSEIFLDFLPYLRAEGIDAFDENTCKPTFNNEKGERALEKYISLKKYAPSDTNSYGNDEVKKAFQNLEAVVAVTWGGQLGFVLNEGCKDIEDIGFAALETGWNVTWSFGINHSSSNWEAANEFLQYISSKEIDRRIGGYAGAPVRRSTYKVDRHLYNWYDVLLEMIENYAKPLPQMNNSGNIFGVLYDCTNQAFNNQCSIKEALDKAEKQIQTLIKSDID